MFQPGPTSLLKTFAFLLEIIDMVFDAERFCWPDPPMCKQYFNVMEQVIPEGTNYYFRCLNSGRHIRKVKHIRELIGVFDSEHDSGNL